MPSLAASTVKVCVNNLFYLECLVDTGSSDSFINLSVVNQFKLKSIPSESHGGSVNLAAGKQAASVYGSCRVSLDVFGEHHVDVPLKVLDSLCTDMILGIDFLSKHKSLHINFGGEGAEIKVNNKSKFCNLTAVNREPPRLFQNLDPEVKPIKAPGRKYSHEDKLFISTTFQNGWKRELLFLVHLPGELR